jgi:hypothetical protein
MKLLKNSNEYYEVIKDAMELKDSYDKPVIFHCYWYGNLNEKHLFSILSCYYFNVYHNKHKIILWLENNIPNEYNTYIEKYAEIRQFSFVNETKPFTINKSHFTYIALYSDCVRTFLLYNYGGIWFDLDCFFLRSFDPLFYKFENEICLYEWSDQKHPNNAIYLSLEPKSEKMKGIIDFVIKRNRGWGFQNAELTYDLPLDILVLPCTWFDADFFDSSKQNPHNIGFLNFFNNTDTRYDFDNFYKGSFCYHWHNQWNKKIEENSIMMQLIKIIFNNLNLTS